MDPRLKSISKRLEDVDGLLPVASGKGGVGKSLIASTTALIASDKGHDVGLLDLDLHGPSAHVILGESDFEFPEEEKGVIPPEVEGIKFMSAVHYSRDNPTPMRGDDITNALKEILAITRWGSLDYLIVDMPPGTGNETLDAIELAKGAEFLVVTTPSKVALSTVNKLIRVLKELEVPIKGVINNMKRKDSPRVRGEIEGLGVEYLGDVRYDNELEEAIGDPKELLKTDFSEDLRAVLPDF